MMGTPKRVVGPWSRLHKSKDRSSRSSRSSTINSSDGSRRVAIVAKVVEGVGVKVSILVIVVN